MRRFLMSSVAAGLSLALIGGPMAMAQVPNGAPPMQHDENHGPMPVQHEADHGPAPPHVTEQNDTMQHGTMQHEMGPQSSMQHPPMQMSQQGHPGAPPMQHETFSSGHRWHSGDHYNGDRHYVSNWNSYHLSPPPSGYQWVQDGSQFVLIAIATGVITSVILNSAYQ